MRSPLSADLQGVQEIARGEVLQAKAELNLNRRRHEPGVRVSLLAGADVPRRISRRRPGASAALKKRKG